MLWENAWAAVKVLVSAARGFRARGAVSWRGFALPGHRPGSVLFTVVPAYALLAMAFGRENFLLEPVPVREPGARGTSGSSSQATPALVPLGEFWPSVRNTIVYVAASLVLCFVHRLPGRVLRRAPARAHEGTADRAPP